MSFAEQLILKTQKKRRKRTVINITYTVPSNIQIFEIKFRQDNVSEKELKKTIGNVIRSIKNMNNAHCDTFTIS